MATTTRLQVTDAGPIAAYREFLKTVLADDSVGAVFVPMRQVPGGPVMPGLITDPALLDRADPLAPSFPLNAARMVSRLTHGETDRPGGMVVAVLRPCEIRAFVELVKLNQGNLDGALIIGTDCYGAYTNAGYNALAAGRVGDELTLEFLRAQGANGLPGQDLDLAPACKACEHPTPEGADLAVELFGANPFEGLPATAQTPRGEGLLSRLGLADAPENPERKSVVDALTAKREAFRDAMFAQTAQATSSLGKLRDYLGACVNCYNCRVACPVCYCRECVFVTDVFDHQPWQYLGWAKHGGAIKMPTDTVFYHLTRLTHMSTACVGCGQCSNACPNGVPVMELFRYVAAGAQEAFEYQAGRSVSEAPPLTVFQEKEYSEVTGGVD
jgi:formate dehydrogenase (coenzyme F420) beta subunit